MSSAAQSPLEALAGRRFAFYPAIVGVEHNEWTLERETWSEILAKNIAGGQELWIPRSHLGEISSVDQPVLIVGLKVELEVKAGSVFPRRGGVVELPGKPIPRPAPDGGAEPEPPPPNRDSSTEAQTFSLIGKALVVGLAAVLVVSVLAFEGFRNPIARLFRPDLSTADQRYLGLNAQDDYHGVVGKLGKPDREEWITADEAELQFEALYYADRRYIVILMGGSRADARYVGTVHDPARKVLDSARMAGGGDSYSLMKNLPKF